MDERATSLGSVSLDGPAAAIAGSYASWDLTYTVGDLGMDDGSELLFATSMTSDWGPPQFDRPGEDNYCSVSTTGDATVDARFDPDGYVRPYKHAISVEVYDGSLAPDEEVTVTIGDTTAGSPGIQVQTFPEDGFVVLGLVDPFGSAEYLEITEPLTFDVIAGPIEDLEAIARQPTESSGEESIPVLVRAVDEWGNIATDYDGSVRLRIDGADTVTADARNGLIETAVPTSGGDPPFRVTVEEIDGSLRAETNPIVPDDPVYWGDPHGQSGETVGTGSITEHFAFARDAAGLDFASHAGNDFQITEDFWETIQQTVESFNDPGRFVTILGYEWSANTPNGGDHNVYFRGAEGDIERSSRWQIEDGPARTDGTHRIADLYDHFSGRDDVLIIPHHGGRRATVEPVDEALTPSFEVTSVWGVFEWFAAEAFDRDIPLGFVGGSDDHTGRPGASRPTNHRFFLVDGGLTGIRTTELTRESVWTALRDRHCYATTGARIRIDTEIAGAAMGQSVDVTADSIEIQATVNGTAPLRGIDLFRDGQRVGSRDLTTGEDRLELEWSGARSTDRFKVQDWSGTLRVDAGRIVEPVAYGCPHPDHGIDDTHPSHVRWTGATAGSYQGIRFGLEGPEETTLSISTPPISRSISAADALEGASFEVGPVDRQLTIRPVGTPSDLDASVDFSDAPPAGESAYYLRVRQADGHMAWSSPTFVSA